MVENGIISTMGLNIKNTEVEKLVSEVALQLGVSKTEAIRQAMQDKAQLLGIPAPKKDPAKFRAFLEEMWQQYPAVRENKVTKADYDALYE
jgi:hypothetical protein